VPRWVIAGASALVLGLATPARAEIVKLTSGRVVTADDLRFDGDELAMAIRGGARVVVTKSMVQEILPDEVPHVRALAVEFLAAAKPTALDGAAIHQLVDRWATAVGVDLKLAHAIVQVESNYEPRALSSKGAMGLMQIMPVVADEFGVKAPFDPEKNLEAGLRHLRDLLTRYDTSRALAAYNAGEGTVQRYGGIPPYRETQDYVRRVLALVGIR
jgi:soluble lytic murein transglycosylase-like protein